MSRAALFTVVAVLAGATTAHAGSLYFPPNSDTANLTANSGEANSIAVGAPAPGVSGSFLLSDSYAISGRIPDQCQATGTGGTELRCSPIKLRFNLADQGDEFRSLFPAPTALEVYAGEDDDSLIGAAGDERLEGESGNDTIRAGLGDDLLGGGSGDDELLADGGDDTVRGSYGDDALAGEDGADTLDGGEGADVLDGGAGADKLFGEEGDDRLDDGAGDDYLDGGEGEDTLSAGDGDDGLFGQAGNDQLIDGAGDDHLDGGEGDDTLSAGAGDDGLFGQAGDDQLTGGAGEDYLDGGEDDDVLTAGAGETQLEGDAGNDRLIGGPASDTMTGGPGQDYFDTYKGGSDAIYARDGDCDVIRADTSDHIWTSDLCDRSAWSEAGPHAVAQARVRGRSGVELRADQSWCNGCRIKSYRWSTGGKRISSKARARYTLPRGTKRATFKLTVITDDGFKDSARINVRRGS